MYRDVFGCDIGNGFGFISLLSSVKADPIPMFPPKYRLNLVGMPTSAYITPPDGNKIEVFDGRSAYDKHKREPEKFVHAIKTRLKEGKVDVPGISSPVSVDLVYAAIVRDLIMLGNEQRKSRAELPVYDVIFTFPASFSGDLPLLNRMQNSIESVRIDGRNIKVVGRLPEPAAAAIDYLYYMQNIAPKSVRIRDNSFTTLVYDLGHGTFDAAVVTASSKEEPYQLHMNTGLSDVGGRDFDKILYDEICNTLKNEYGYIPQNNNARETIRLAAIKMKHELSDAEASCVPIILPNGDSAGIEITRDKFERKSRHLINQTFELVDRMMQQSKEDGIHIDAVVLSGGASQMPMVTDGLNELLKEENIPVCIYRPSTAVSYGAARYAFGRASNSQPIPNPILEKYAEYSYGLWMPSGQNLTGIVNFMIKSKEKLPAESKSIRFTSPSSRVVLKLHRSLNKYSTSDSSDTNHCIEIIRVPFEVPANSECELKIVVLEDGNVKMVCKTSDGVIIEKSTLDMLGKLL